jgi:hypothetical protein
MPLIKHADPAIAELLEAQVKWGLSDTQFGEAILGKDISDPGKTVRGWRGDRPPTPTALQSFKYLKALVAITNNSPLSDAEENFSLAHAALPAALQ